MEEYLLGEMGGWDEGIGINVVCIYVYEWKGEGGGVSLLGYGYV